MTKQRVKRTGAGKRDRGKKNTSKSMLTSISEKVSAKDTPKQAKSNDYTSKLRQRKTADAKVVTGEPKPNSSKNSSSQIEEAHDCDDSTATETLSNVINKVPPVLVDLVDIHEDADDIAASATALITPSKLSLIHI